MEPRYIDRKILIMALYSNYHSIELEYNLLINKKMEGIWLYWLRTILKNNRLMCQELKIIHC